MKKAKEIILKILGPALPVKILFFLLSLAGLTCVFLNNDLEKPWAYFIYAFSTYVLLFLVYSLVVGIKKVKKKAALFLQSKSKIAKEANRYRSDPVHKRKVHLVLSAAIDGVYSLFELVLGILSFSPWPYSLFAYHLLLGFLRLYLAFESKRKKSASSWGKAKKVALFLLLLTLPMGVLIALMVYKDYGFSYPGTLIYLTAAYAFFRFGSALPLLFQKKSKENPILFSSGILNLIAASMSLLGLQTAMIDAFSSNQEAFRFLMNGLTGSAVLLLSLFLSLLLFFKSKRNEAKDKKKLSQKESEASANELIGPVHGQDDSRGE